MGRTLPGSVGLLVGLASVVVGPTALAEPYPAYPGTVTVSPTSVGTPTQAITVQGSGYPNGEGCRNGRVRFATDGQAIDQARLFQTGFLDAEWSFTRTTFEDGPFASGQYTILIQCNDLRGNTQSFSTTAEVTILPTATTVPPPTTTTTVPATTTTTTASGSTTTTVPATQGTVDPTMATAGVTVLTLRGAGFKAEAALQITLDSTPPLAVGSAKATATGSYATTVTLPRTAPAGDRHVVVTGPGPDGTTRSTTASLTVLAAAATAAAGGTGTVTGSSGGTTTAASSTLPKTGSERAPGEVVAGLAALTLGALLVGLSHPAPAGGHHRRPRGRHW